MDSLLTHGLTELDATEMITLSGGESLPLKIDPDDAWTWLVEKITGPMKQDPEIQMP